MQRKIILSSLSMTSLCMAAQEPCYPETCAPCERCLGPETFAGNPPVCPMTCDGDLDVTVALFCWEIYQDGMEFAIDTDVTNPSVPATPDIRAIPTPESIAELNQLTGARYKKPISKWEGGFKIGLDYCSACDGWDTGLTWTRFHGKGINQISADPDSNHTLIALWSQFAPAQAGVVYATAAATDWKVKLNLLDAELGRHFWVSRYLSVRPFIGARFASIRQHFEIFYDGGSWSANFDVTPFQPPFNGIVDLHNYYKGAGLRTGFDSEWNFGCGWALYGNAAASLIYGRFSIDHDEYIRLARSPHTITSILETEESFRATRSILDLALGVKWSTMFCSCKYGFIAMLGFEQHLFFDQNHMWRVGRVRTAQPQSAGAINLNLSGDNILNQSRGTLTTQGLTLTLKFEY